MITFVARMTVRPEHAAAWEALVTEVRDLTRANEPGVVYYDFARSADEPGGYVVIEVYRDPAAHSAHMRQPYVVASLAKSRTLIDGNFEIARYVSPGADPAARVLKEV